MKRHRRRLVPYTARGIRRIPCGYRGCRRRHSFAQWKVCANVGEYVAVCWVHDIELNGVVLEVLGDRDARAKSAAYAATVIKHVHALKQKRRA